MAFWFLAESRYFKAMGVRSVDGEAAPSRRLRMYTRSRSASRRL